MRYALTGATGFVGGELARQLVGAGHDVVALVRTPGRAAALRELGVELVAGDLDDTAALDRLLTGRDGAGTVDGLFHVAGWYRLGDRDRSPGQRVNVEGTRNVLLTAQRAGVPRVVYTSTLAVNSDTRGRVVDESFTFRGTHLSEYDRTKAAAHEVAEQFAADGLPVVIVMPGGIYGPGDTSQVGQFIEQVVAGGRPQAPGGSGAGKPVWCHVADIAAGHLLAMERGAAGESYMLAGEPATLADVLQRVAQLAGTKGPIVVPAAMVKATGRVMEPLSRLLPIPPTFHPETVRAALATYLGTPAKAERELGWRGRSLDQGLAETVSYLQRR
jgi:nucleoside-diphosphate-sugar epimerase